MYSRLVVPLVCAAAIVFACGPRPRTAAAPATTSAGGRVLGFSALDGTRPAPRKRHAGDTTKVDASFDVGLGPEGLQLALHVVNQTTRRLEIDFPDGRTRDFVILDAVGREVWRWSNGRLFTQGVQNKFVAAGDTVVYGARWDRAVPGQYTAVAVLRSRNFPVERRVRFDLRPSGVAVASAR